MLHVPLNDNQCVLGLTTQELSFKMPASHLCPWSTITHTCPPPTHWPPVRTAPPQNTSQLQRSAHWGWCPDHWPFTLPAPGSRSLHPANLLPLTICCWTPLPKLWEATGTAWALPAVTLLVAGLLRYTLLLLRPACPLPTEALLWDCLTWTSVWPCRTSTLLPPTPLQEPHRATALQRKPSCSLIIAPPHRPHISDPTLLRPMGSVPMTRDLPVKEALLWSSAPVAQAPYLFPTSSADPITSTIIRLKPWRPPYLWTC